MRKNLDSFIFKKYVNFYIFKIAVPKSNMSVEGLEVLQEQGQGKRAQMKTQ